MESFVTLYKAFQENPAAALLVLVLLAIVWIVKDSRARELAYQTRIDSLHEQHATKMQAQTDAHLQTALKVVPLATKLVDVLEYVERLSTRPTVGGGA